MFKNKRDAETRLAQLLMEDLRIDSCQAILKPLPSSWFSDFREERKKFLESLGSSIQELAMLNLSQRDFMNLLSGISIPENLCVKFRKPILYGGAIAAENMFMMVGFPYGFNLDIFMAEQLGQGEIWYPNPAKKIYVSITQLAGGAGGNATTDRLAQGFAAMNREGRQ